MIPSFNLSTAKGRDEITTTANFCQLHRHLDQQPKFFLWLFLDIFSARTGAINLNSYDFASWRHDVSKWLHFLETWKLASTHIHDQELWKTERNRSCITWTTKFHDDMTRHMTILLSSHDIRDMTSRHDFIFISMKLDIWLLLYVAVRRKRWTGAMILLMFRALFRSRNTFWLSRFAWPLCVTLKLKITSWFTYVTFVISACIRPTVKICSLFREVFCPGIHSNYWHLRDAYVWPWNWRSRHGLRDVEKSRRPWRDLQFSRSHVKIAQMALVRMNSLIWRQWRDLRFKGHALKSRKRR